MTYPPPPLPEDEEEQEDPKPGVPSTHAVAATQYSSLSAAVLGWILLSFAHQVIKLKLGDSSSSRPANATSAASFCPSTHRRTVDTCCSLSNNPAFTSCHAHEVAEQTARHALASIGRKFLTM